MNFVEPVLASLVSSGAVMTAAAYLLKKTFEKRLVNSLT